MSYRIKIDARSSKAGRFIRRVHTEIQRAFSASGLSQQQLATKLDVNRATINRRLLGEENLTLRSIADMAWALDADIVFEFRQHKDAVAGNRQSRVTASTTEIARAVVSGTFVTATSAAPQQPWAVAANA